MSIGDLRFDPTLTRYICPHSIGISIQFADATQGVCHLSDMITLSELLKDPVYKKFFTTVPKLPDHYTRDSMPWKLMILKHGETQWRTKKFGTYAEAFRALKKLLPDIADATINCPGLGFQPPIRMAKVKGKTDAKGNPIIRAVVWKPQITSDMADHYWCAYCRRPTKFGYFEVHPAMTKARVGRMGAHVDPSLMRCFICGASELINDLRRPERNQGWDVNRVKVA